MRYRPEHKAGVRQQIVESASRQFRSAGMDSVGIVPLMKALGLTHGGFYAHFADKEQLSREALDFAIGESANMLSQALESGGVELMLAQYLSASHRDNPQKGCPLPSLSSEVARHPLPMREAFAARMDEIVEMIADHLPPSVDNRRARAATVLSGMVGGLMLARAISEPDLSQEILEATAHHLESVAEGA